MTLEIEALSAFTDNYIWLVKNLDTKQVAVVDPGEAAPILDWLNEHPEWQLTDILITHHHQDHIGGIKSLRQHSKVKVFAPDTPLIADKDVVVSGNQSIQAIGHTFYVMSVPGHTLDHVTYFLEETATSSPRLFSGDTLFSAGCGRVFEGTMEQMYESLQYINTLPANTLIYPAHEYTVSNLKFALIVEPNNLDIQQHLNKCIQLRASQQITLPSTLMLERRINPFLRCEQSSILETIHNTLKLTPQSPEEVFSALRNWKNRL